MTHAVYIVEGSVILRNQHFACAVSSEDICARANRHEYHNAGIHAQFDEKGHVQAISYTMPHIKGANARYVIDYNELMIIITDISETSTGIFTFTSTDDHMLSQIYTDAGVVTDTHLTFPVELLQQFNATCTDTSALSRASCFEHIRHAHAQMDSVYTQLGITRV